MKELLVEKIQDEKGTRADEKYKYLDMIAIEDLHRITIAALNEYGTEEKLEEANKVAELVVALLNKKKLLNPHAQQSFVDVLLTATMLHNLFYNPENWVTLFDARKILEPVFLEFQIPQQVCDAIFQTVESQLGDDTPVPLCKPAPNSPTELFAYAIFFLKEFNK